MERMCKECRSASTNANKWYKYKDGYICKKCYSRLIGNPKWHPVTNPIYNARQMLFMGKRITLKENPRKGRCKQCGRGKGDEYINRFGEKAKVKRTAIHHKKYHKEDPLKDTTELCNSCHSKVLGK